MKKFGLNIIAIEGRDPYIRVDFAGELNECDSTAIKISLEKMGDSIEKVNMNISPEGKHYAIIYRHPCATIEKTMEDAKDILNNYVFIEN